MADVLQFKPKKSVKAAAATPQEVFAMLVEDISTDWARAANNNRLNQYFVSSVAQAREQHDYMGDLNALSMLEQKLFMGPTIVGPKGAKTAETFGWRVFLDLPVIGEVSTPPMAFETYARCFAILIFTKIKLRDFLV